MGRDAELGSLAGAVEEVAGGGARTVLVRGEAGIGKTRMLGELPRLAAGRLTVRGARATEFEREVPLAPVADLLDPAAAGLLDGDGAPSSPAERWRRHREIRRALEDLRGARPPALVLDDVHWCDPATLELVEHLLRRPLERPHLLALAARPGAVADRLAAAAGPGAVLLDLAPLATDASEAILAGVADPAARARMARSAGGNPLLLQELARTGPGAELPGGLLSAVAVEVGRLGPDARALLAGAAIAGDPFDLDLAGAVAGLGGPALLGALDEALASGLAQATGDPRRFAFRHPVVRAAITERMPAGRRIAGHAAAAAALRGRAAPAAVQAVHLAAAAEPGDRDAAATLRAAAAAVRGDAPGVAAGWLAAARRIDPGRRGARRVELAEALSQAGRPDEVLAVAAEHVAEEPDETARMAVVAAGAERLLGRHDAARIRLERALGLAPPEPWPGRLLCELALAAYERGDGEATAARARQARERGGADPVVRSATGALLGVALLHAGRIDDARVEVAGALDALAGASDDALVAAGDLPTAVPWAALAVEDLDAAVMAGERVAAAARRRGDGIAAVGPAAAAVVALSLLGRIGEAVRAADEVEQAARVTGRDQAVQWALWMRAWTLLEGGDLEAATADATESARLAERLDASVLGTISRAVLGAVLVARGEHARAVPLLAAYDADPGWVCRWTPWLVDALLAEGRAEEAAARVATAGAVAAGLGLAGPGAAVARAAAAVALDAGDATAAAAHADAALDAARELGAQLDVARAQLLAGRARAAGDREGAIALLERAWHGAAACGAGRVRDQAVRELRRLGRRVGTGAPRAAGDAGVASLSRREREIAGLVAEGLTNRQIGARIHLSEKTVETHLSRVFAKLGARGRAAVAARIAQEGPGP